AGRRPSAPPAPAPRGPRRAAPPCAPSCSWRLPAGPSAEAGRPPARPRRRSRPRQRRRRPRPTRRSAPRRRGAATARRSGRCPRAPPRRYMRSTLDAQMALQAELLETTEALEPHLGAWDALAVARSRPYCAPGWMLSWLGAVAPPDALLRACVVREGGELVAIAPLWTQDGDGGGR